jgi:hypothetical protein
MAKKAAARWKNLDSLIRGHGEITLGRVGPVPSAAVAADGGEMLAALVRRPRESLEDLLTRLDEALERRWEHEELIDEING